MNEWVFVEAARPLSIPWQAACRALGKALDDGGLVSESHRAVEDGLVFVMPVGPLGGDHFSAHDVLVRVQSTSTESRSMQVALRWEPVGASRHMLPSLDGNLTLIDTGPATSSLSIIASYRPPLGAVGKAVDRAVMSRVADATMSALLREVADHIEQLVEPEDPGD